MIDLAIHIHIKMTGCCQSDCVIKTPPKSPSLQYV